MCVWGGGGGGGLGPCSLILCTKPLHTPPCYKPFGPMGTAKDPAVCCGDF